MSVRSLHVVPGILLVLLLGVSSPGLAAEKAAAPGKAAPPAAEPSCAELVRAALQAEASGKGADRNQLLEQALAKQPDFAPARWHAGYVREGGRWLDADQAQRQAGADKRLAEYRQLRDEKTFDPQSDLILARWCRDRGLAAEARAHWLRVLDAQPQNAEAISALGVAWHRGQLLARDQAEQLQKPQPRRRVSTGITKEEKEWMTYWETQLAAWRRAMERDQSSPDAALRAELEDGKEPLAVQVLAALLAARSQGTQDRKFYQQLNLSLVRWFEYRDEPWIVPQLVRQSLDHPLAEVRTAAADALKKKPKEQYVPLLLQRLRLPVEASGAIASLGLGGVVYQYSLEREGPNGVYVENYSTHAHVRDVSGLTSGDSGAVRVQGTVTAEELRSAQDRARVNTSAALAAGRTQAAQLSVGAHQRAAATLGAVQRQVQAANAQTAEQNQKVESVLAKVTGADVADDPVAWMKWWEEYCYDYYEVGRPPEEEKPAKRKPVYESTWYGYAPIEFSSPSTGIVSVGRRPTPAPTAPVRTPSMYGRVRSSGSCFPWNTKVWTLTGPMNIDQIKPGDRVLSQSPRTGELAYKPVLQVTRLKPVPLVEIGTGQHTLLATRGHPFWVCGQGWKMAKELQVGMQLHSVSGPVVIDRLAQLPAAGPWYEQLQKRPDAKPEDALSYNLIVDDFHNYFVGDGKFLVHDIVLFLLDGPMPRVPGLASR